MMTRLTTYVELTKPRVNTMVVLTAAAGFYLGSTGLFNWWLFLHALLGTGLIASGTAVLNEVLEQDNDSRMRRTSKRPLPARRLSRRSATLFGVALVIGSTVYLAAAVNLLTACLGFLTSLIYLAVYTPLKTRTSLCTTVGAFSGASPPLMGWTAVRGSVDWDALLLFAILFFWQFPHFLAIAWVYKEDYERGGFKMLPLFDDSGGRTAGRVLFFNIVLLGVSLLPSLTGLTGLRYLQGAALLGGTFLWFGGLLARERSLNSARLLLRASVIYLPLLLSLMVVDKA